jgi:hypothetical protein
MRGPDCPPEPDHRRVSRLSFTNANQIKVETATGEFGVFGSVTYNMLGIFQSYRLRCRNVRGWIETDDAVTLKFAVVLLSGDWILIHGIGTFFVAEGRNVSFDHYKQDRALLGDVVDYDKTEFIIIGRN